MASVFITKRQTKSGPRHVVRYRLGGFGWPIVHGGSFRMKKDALVRQAFITNEIAAGRNPTDALEALREEKAPPEPPNVVTLSEKFDEFIAIRNDVGVSAIRLYGNAKNKLGQLADMNPAEVEPADVQAWITEIGDLAPKTIRHYLSTLRQVLDFCKVQPNPARDRWVKVPDLEDETIAPPSRGEVDAILAKLRGELVLPVRLMEACGLRIGELTQLTYGDLDLGDEDDDRNPRIRVSRTKRGTAGKRWLPVPAELMDEIAGLVPLEDTHKDRRVFPFTAPTVRDAIARACKFAGSAHYHPHDLRHRRISLWFAHGVDAVQVKTWAGHSNATMSLDVYANVNIDPKTDEWRGFWRFAYENGRGGVVSVWSREALED